MGSTNAYTEDASGRPVYDWTIVDRIFDRNPSRRKPFVEIGFMPEALSIHPQPYARNWPSPTTARLVVTLPKTTPGGGNWATNGYSIRFGATARASRELVLGGVDEPDISYWKGTVRSTTAVRLTLPRR